MADETPNTQSPEAPFQTDEPEVMALGSNEINDLYDRISSDDNIDMIEASQHTIAAYRSTLNRLYSHMTATGNRERLNQELLKDGVPEREEIREIEQRLNIGPQEAATEWMQLKIADLHERIAHEKTLLMAYENFRDFRVQYTKMKGESQATASEFPKLNLDAFPGISSVELGLREAEMNGQMTRIEKQMTDRSRAVTVRLELDQVSKLQGPTREAARRAFIQAIRVFDQGRSRPRTTGQLRPRTMEQVVVEAYNKETRGAITTLDQMTSENVAKITPQLNDATNVFSEELHNRMRSEMMFSSPELAGISFYYKMIVQSPKGDVRNRWVSEATEFLGNDIQRFIDVNGQSAEGGWARDRADALKQASQTMRGILETARKNEYTEEGFAAEITAAAAALPSDNTESVSLAGDLTANRLEQLAARNSDGAIVADKQNIADISTVRGRITEPLETFLPDILEFKHQLAMEDSGYDYLRVTYRKDPTGTGEQPGRTPGLLEENRRIARTQVETALRALTAIGTPTEDGGEGRRERTRTFVNIWERVAKHMYTDLSGKESTEGADDVLREFQESEEAKNVKEDMEIHLALMNGAPPESLNLTRQNLSTEQLAQIQKFADNGTVESTGRLTLAETTATLGVQPQDKFACILLWMRLGNQVEVDYQQLNGALDRTFAKLSNVAGIEANRLRDLNEATRQGAEALDKNWELAGKLLEWITWFLADWRRIAAFIVAWKVGPRLAVAGLKGTVRAGRWAFSRKPSETGRQSSSETQQQNNDQLRDELRQTVQEEFASQRQQLQDFGRFQRRVAALETEVRTALQQSATEQEIDFQSLHARWGELKTEIARSGLDEDLKADLGLDTDLQSALEIKIK